MNPSLTAASETNQALNDQNFGDDDQDAELGPREHTDSTLRTGDVSPATTSPPAVVYQLVIVAQVHHAHSSSDASVEGSDRSNTENISSPMLMPVEDLQKGVAGGAKKKDALGDATNNQSNALPSNDCSSNGTTVL